MQSIYADGKLSSVHRLALVRSFGKPTKRSAKQAPKSSTEVVQGAWNSLAALLKNVGVDHGGGKIVVAE